MATVSLLAEVKDIHQSLQSINSVMDELSPIDQANTAVQLNGAGRRIAELQQKVQATFMRQAGAIQGISEEDLTALSEELRESAEILESIEKGTAIATAIAELQSEIEALSLAGPTFQQLNVLNARIDRLTRTHQYLNTGARSAIATLHQCLQAMYTLAPTTPAPIPSAAPHPSAGAPSRSQPPQPSSPETMQQRSPLLRPQVRRTEEVVQSALPPQTSTPDLRRRVPQREDRSFDVAQLYPRLESLNTETTNPSPEAAFERVILFYQELLAFDFSHHPSDKARLIGDTETLIERIIRNQQNFENPRPVVPPVQVLKEIRQTIESAITALKESKKAAVGDFVRAIHDVYFNLDMQIRDQLAEAMEAVRNRASQASIIRTPLVSFGTWPGSWEQKRDAVDAVLAKLATASQPQAANPSPEALKQIQRLLEQLETNLGNPQVDIAPMQRSVVEAYRTLTQDQKEALLRETGNIVGRELPKVLLQQSIHLWPLATLQQKRQAVNAVLAPAAPESSDALDNLKTRLHSLVMMRSQPENLKKPYYDLVEEVFTKLDPEQKKKISEMLGQILKRPVPPNMLRFTLKDWPGTWEQKLEAVNRILQPTHFMPIAPPAKKSEEMQKKFDELKAFKLIDDLPPPDPLDIDAIVHEFALLPNNQILPKPSLAWVEQDDYGNVFGSMALQFPSIGALPLLTRIGSQLETHSDIPQPEALGFLKTLGEKRLTAAFKISDHTPRAIEDRLFFHLYYIHKNETKTLKEDMDYGRKAFLGMYPAKNEERLRTILRTTAELILETLEDMINFEQTGSKGMETLLALLDTDLDAKDAVEGHANLAQLLYGAFYRLHASAQAQDPSLANPDDARYKGDFGRIAFMESGAKIDPALKLAAIVEVRRAMKTTWKVG